MYCNSFWSIRLPGSKLMSCLATTSATQRRDVRSGPTPSVVLPCQLQPLCWVSGTSSASTGLIFPFVRWIKCPRDAETIVVQYHGQSLSQTDFPPNRKMKPSQASRMSRRTSRIQQVLVVWCKISTCIQNKRFMNPIISEPIPNMHPWTVHVNEP